MPKDIRYGSIPEEYVQDGQKQTSWNPAGYKAVIDWEERKLFVVDGRTGKKIIFAPKREESQQSESIDF